MNQHLGYITVLVDDYDEAIDFYINKLNFILIEDSVISETKRWVLVRPSGENSCCLLLAKAANDLQKSMIGNQTGGRVFLFLFTDNFDRDFKNLIDNGITIEREPVVEKYGTIAVFKDIYGNLWDLIEPSSI
jgi:catechol 2,3-dioxygenase-like lactoylglutathione lyase family enzyme